MAKNLADLQAALQKDVIDGTTDTLARLSVPEGSSPQKRLFVYQNAYISRLVEFLCEDFDTTWTFLGDQTFYDLVRKFIRENPSQTPNARWFSHGFPEFLEQQEIGQKFPAICELAKIERALGDAFDAPNAEVFSLMDLTHVAQTGIENAVMTLHPSAALLRLESNSYDILKALRAEDQPPAPSAAPEPRWLLVWRRDMTCRHMELDLEQGTLLDLARSGSSFEALCEVSATMNDPETSALRMAQFLSGWIDNQLVVSFE